MTISKAKMIREIKNNDKWPLKSAMKKFRNTFRIQTKDPLRHNINDYFDDNDFRYSCTLIRFPVDFSRFM